MIKLCDIFCQQAPGAAPAENEAEQQTGSASGSASGSGASNTDLTLEYRDTPFTSFMRRVQDMIHCDPREALRLVQNAKEAKLFVRAHEKERIKNAMTRIVDALHREQPQGLAASFFRSVLDLPVTPSSEARHPQNLGQHLRPTFTAPAMSLNPLPAPV